MLRTASAISNNPLIIDAMRDRELYAHLDSDDDAVYCENCGKYIGPNTDNYLLDDERYCDKCDHAMRDRLDNFLADLLGYHVSDEALDAIMVDCERTGCAE